MKLTVVALLLLGTSIANAAVSQRLCSKTTRVDGGTDEMHCCCDQALSSKNSKVKCAMIAIPGAGSDAHWFWDTRILPFIPSGASDTTNGTV